jgi:NADH-quinone oxidoreductase subunit A
MMNPQISAFGMAFLFILGGIVLVLVGLLVASLLRPHQPNYEKLRAYECGEEAIGTVWGQFNGRYYVIALIFVLFEVEIVFLFPWATVFGQKELIAITEGRWGWFSLAEVWVFIGILVLGLAYIWAKGHLEWLKPAPQATDYQSKIPIKVYEQINQKQYEIKKESVVSEVDKV